MGDQPENEAFEMANRPVSPLSVVTEEDNPESVDTTSTGTPKPEDTQDGTQSVSDGLLAPSREDKIAEGDAATVHTGCPLKRHVLYSLITVAFIGSVSLVGGCWLIAHIQAKTDKRYIAAVIVGGKLSSTEAKLIDASFSILVAPAVVAVANWHMFKLARLSAVNEHSGRNSAVSMKVLVEVASTDWGSFSPLKFWTFVRSRRPRVICLGIIAVLSALSFSLLGNSVAYQQAGVDTSTQVLEYLHDTHSVLPGGSQPIPLDDQSIQQQVSARLQDRLSRLQQGIFDRQSWDLETLADAFLWYEMESRQVLLDNDQAGRAERYQVQSNIDEYAMTFIPWILLSGLGTLGVACVLTIGIALDSWKAFEECSTWRTTRLNKCADEARFQYEADARLDSATGLYTLGIRLRQISRPHD
ncbi:uncharacterized protein BKA55DRAFT_594452 [Fusarium redolens]|uniref:Uncharacterized protein n=1 Tax=Fusarium redolens TaxID=48865 RepID=A0A9P9K419_FUSRE|nr:uncharacterized protein BKA55DRAFT_594452 [Fusarium redolens]KAH7248502.1 hypothetical protein BKA55DRAFT_594452 [Fusarium redolens]